MAAMLDISPALASTCIAGVASWCVLDLGSRLAFFNGLRRRLWLVAGAAAIGTGWVAMSVVGLGAFGFAVSLASNALTATLAELAAVSLTAIALMLVGRHLQLVGLAKIGAALMAAAAIGTMQYTAMSALQIPVEGTLVPPAADLSLTVLSIAMMLSTSFASRFDLRTTERREAMASELAEADRVHRLAYFDSVTGLPNRSLFTEKLLKQLVDADSRGTVPFSLVYAELRDYRPLVQRLGDQQMNRVLLALTDRIVNEFRGDSLARLSHDGLILMVQDREGRDLNSAISALCAQLSTPVTSDSGDVFRFAWGIGHSRFPDDGQSTQSLIRAATTIQRQIGMEPPSSASSTKPRLALAS